MRTFERYQQNLKYDDKFIYSYDTKVAIIDKELGNLVKLKWKVDKMTSSPTTTKHINYASKELGLEVAEFNLLTQYPFV